MTLNEQEQRRLCEMYVSGLSSTELAPEFGCSHWFVLKTLRLNGIKRRPVGTGAKDLKSIKRAEDLMSNRHKILALYEKEVAICNIAVLCRCRKKKIRSILRDLGVLKYRP